MTRIFGPSSARRFDLAKGGGSNGSRSDLPKAAVKAFWGHVEEMVGFWWRRMTAGERCSVKFGTSKSAKTSAPDLPDFGAIGGQLQGLVEKPPQTHVPKPTPLTGSKEEIACISCLH